MKSLVLQMVKLIKKLNTKNEKQLVRILGGMWDKFGKNVKIGSSL